MKKICIECSLPVHDEEDSLCVLCREEVNELLKPKIKKKVLFLALFYFIIIVIINPATLMGVGFYVIHKHLGYEVVLALFLIILGVAQAFYLLRKEVK